MSCVWCRGVREARPAQAEHADVRRRVSRIWEGKAAAVVKACADKAEER
jgi:hypothetical protein